METKSPFKSKTIWMAFILSGLAFFPPVHEIMAQNPETYAIIMGAIFAGLRMISKGKISIE